MQLPYSIPNPGKRSNGRVDHFASHCYIKPDLTLLDVMFALICGSLGFRIVRVLDSQATALLFYRSQRALSGCARIGAIRPRSHTWRKSMVSAHTRGWHTPSERFYPHKSALTQKQ